MIRTSTFTAVLACVALLQGISGATYSNVFVQSGGNIRPMDYVKYGTPTVPVSGAQIAQISAAPVDSIVPVPSVPALVSPCVAPCVIQGAPLSAVAPISSTANAKIVTYKSPISNVPVVLANKDDATGYQYAYAVYDESTGDKKTQSEQSDGSVVQGQYSFIQPDGYRREVVYTADDLKGFNAVVRNFLTESSGTTKDGKKEAKDDQNEKAKDDKKELPPCKNVKSEQLTALPVKEEVSKESVQPLEIEQIDVQTQEPTTTITQPIDPVANSDPNANSLIPYNEVIKCLQAKLQTNKNPSAISPLTYILIPSLGSFSGIC